MKKLTLNQQELITAGGKKMDDWLWGFCLGFSIGSAFISGGSSLVAVWMLRGTSIGSTLACELI